MKREDYIKSFRKSFPDYPIYDIGEEEGYTYILSWDGLINDEVKDPTSYNWDKLPDELKAEIWWMGDEDGWVYYGCGCLPSP